MPVQANATLTTVGEAHAATAGSVDDWDVITAAPSVGSPAADALVKWQGSARAYYRESTERAVGPDGATDVRLKRELILDTDDVLEAGIDTDDVLTFTVDGRAGVRTGRASIIPTPTLAGIPRSLQTARIRLEDT